MEAPICSGPVAEGPVGHPRWAKGFGWLEAGRILWLAEGGDTTYLAHEWTGPGPGGRDVLTLGQAEDIRMATWSTTHVPFVRAVGATNQWVASGYADRLPGTVPQIGNLGGDAGLDEEMLLMSGANVLTSYPFGNPMEGTAQRTGIPILPLTEYAEPHPLGRAEYLRLFGWLTGRMDEADRLFSDIETSYLDVLERAGSAAEANGRPVVFTGSSRSGRWTAPGADGLVARLIQDAGGEYAFDTPTAERMSLKRMGANYEVELEQCAAIASLSSHWGKVVHAPEGWTRQAAEEEAHWCDLKDKSLFHCNTAEVDYFGQAVIEPHRMLADLAHLLQDIPLQGPPAYFKPTP